ncbi:protein FAM210B, mitochondrial [Archocentrus centrarchus]|uniref:protein FAM210B, mitochondrial n=1 Tax=Archocentrus centrarchus TaxID=63155 RepID=UPI0011EA51B6|nr:protein FAM210B, mitochondrial [Archocentrus centrarchus]
MFLCRTAAALDVAFKSQGSFLVRVKANRLKDVTLTLREGHSFQRYRCFCASARRVDLAPVHLGKQHPELIQNWDVTSSFAARTGWVHLDRVTAVAVSLSKSVHREGAECNIIREPFVFTKRRRNSGGDPVGNVLFKGNWDISSRHCSTRTMQIRSSSTQTAAKKSEEQTDDNKGDVQTLKEASTASSEKSLGNKEPDGEKPNKTQQLKKVFKEYGAVGVSFHIGISLMSLGMFYLLISSGIDMTAMLYKLGFSEAIVQSKTAAGTSTFVLAYAIHKLFAPVRISITLVSVPLIVRYFRKTGLFKPPTPAP